ncbi:MAG: hypothetical protein A2887_00890 [Alphaproteobacteria bacterium RIFCSPLOWO2_01_FULL_40_26]|nr:MAG: hypothetical protein A2887_00890 [Alphaproteobacteria bacterium RIFCSPLOWO2_01_FULL_40_26]OFX10260.1 MAG: hypothetical protein A3H30_00870 [Alphaproteobacteria bacterium RIFCSPLOWO2_02_FULL_40_19]OFX11513.1 MAG: hypothetical protein A3G22_04750 [Alphaproteobacteria bacterium RIFCSPLOWO2_12_FULL_40_11]
MSSAKVEFDLMLFVLRASCFVLRRSRNLFVILIFISSNSFALPSFKNVKQSDMPAVLKADEIDGDRLTNTLTAKGNVEVSKGESIIYADEMIYNKDGKIIRAIGNVKIKNLEIGNMRATEGEVKDDFSQGNFLNGRIFFNDGSYLFSPKVERKTPLITTLYKPIYSFCPNDEIKEDNSAAGKKRDFASITSSKTTIDRENNVMKSRNGILRFYNVPVLYTPYIRIPLPSKKRESGFLTPNYTKNTNFGFGVKIPYYWNIAPNADLTITPHLNLNSNQYMVNNNFRHLVSYGEYDANFEFANNEIESTKDRIVIERTNKDRRWNLKGGGKFDFTTDIGSDFKADFVSDRNYLRDYHFNYSAYTLSEANVDYIKGRNFFSAKTVKFQELEDKTNKDSEQFILPTLDSRIETKPFFFKEKFVLTSNITSINRESGLQYRRFTAIPEAKIPFNLKGNLFELGAKFQGDFYWLENNFKHTQRNNNYEYTTTNYKPEFSANWRLPLIKKTGRNTLMVEPMIGFVASYYKKNVSKMPNEDSNNSELTISNLFVSDRIYGFDRNEVGERIGYGVKSSLFNKYGEFGLMIGQGYRRNNEVQDVTIRGFAANNKSNVVGQAMYKATKYFSITYAFQLNESNYRNDINQIAASLDLQRFSFAADYLLIRRSQQIPEEREQVSLSSGVKLTNRLKVNISGNRDLITGRTISRGIKLYREGCCTTFEFSAIENDPSNLVKPQRTFNLSLSFKNL